jgi:hypothetical protein
LQNYTASLKADFARQRGDIIHFLQGQGEAQPAVVPEDSDAQEYDTDPDDLPSSDLPSSDLPSSDFKPMQSLIETSPIENSPDASTRKGDHIGTSKSLRAVAATSNSLRSLCSAANANMTLASPTTAAVYTDLLATPRARATEYSLFTSDYDFQVPNWIFENRNIPYMRVNGPPFEGQSQSSHREWD